jgi:beta-galactosidase
MEAFAYGAGPSAASDGLFAQEQMHGLLRLTASPRCRGSWVADEIAQMPDHDQTTGTVALIFVESAGLGHPAAGWISRCSRLALRAEASIDILPRLWRSDYKLVLAPGLMTLSDPLRAALRPIGASPDRPAQRPQIDAASLPIRAALPDTDVTVTLTKATTDRSSCRGGGAFTTGSSIWRTAPSTCRRGTVSLRSWVAITCAILRGGGR